PALGPAPLGIVEVRQRLERRVALAHGQDLSQIGPGGRDKVEALPFGKLARIDDLALDFDAVHGTEDYVERPSRENVRGLLGEPVRLAKLHPAQYADAGVLGPASVDRLELCGDVDAVLSLLDVHEVGW